ncbi:hypothetical protein FQA39_LY14833 [Lamprigera yunnana]|nr:hypothetical protein FQA39_LY14833 [Lamprigera yunnana]
MVEEDHLEYYIKFPAAKVELENEKKTPIAILFGWAGCKDKHLCKYSQIYESEGFITLRYSAPLKFVLWQQYRLKPIGERLAQLLQDMNFENHPILIHCFSNGGATILYNFLVALRGKPFDLKGVIFDSSPGQHRILNLYRAIATIIGGNLLYNFSLSLLITLVVVILWQAKIIKCYFTNDNDQSNSLQYLHTESNKCPQYFIYSKADKLIYYKDVEEFMRVRKNMGVDVTYLKLEESPHLKHYMFYKKEYLDGINNFLVKYVK